MELKRYLRYINKSLALLIAALFLVTILSTVYLIQTLVDSRALIRDGGNAAGAVLVLQDLEINLQTAESSQRGYIITADSNYLKIYTVSVTKIPVEQKQLTNKAYAINPKQLKVLNDLIHRRLEGMKRSLDARNTQGLDAAVAMISSSTALQTTSNIQALIGQIAEKKFAPYTPIIQHAQNRLRFALYVAITMIGLVFVISMLIVLYFQRAIAKERATEGVKNEFLSLASHQLRTPASNVKQYLGLLLEGYLGKLKPKQIEALEVANKNNEIGINIINDLLDVAKLDLEKIHLNKEKVDIYKLAKEVVGEYRPHLRERRQTIKFDRRVKKVEALVDRTYIKSVIENLLDNASKYSPKNSRITIEIGEKAHKKAVLSIKDEGVGMKKREMVKLFRKFSRIPSDHSRNVEGSGLGLYWVKQIVDLHGGRVVVRSKHGKGSVFIIELPMH